MDRFIAPISSAEKPARVDFKQKTIVSRNRSDSPNNFTLFRWKKITTINISGSNAGGNMFKF